MMKENSPSGVTDRPTRSDSRVDPPMTSMPVVTASGRATSTNNVMPKINAHDSATARGSISMPMETKKTALNTSRIPSKARLTWILCGVSATIAPSMKAPSAREKPA